MTNTIKLMDKIFGISSYERNVISQLFITGPTWDGDIVSKYGRGKLVDAGLVERLHGYSYLTETGMRYAIEHMALGETKQTLRHEAQRRPGEKKDHA